MQELVAPRALCHDQHVRSPPAPVGPPDRGSTRVPTDPLSCTVVCVRAAAARFMHAKRRRHWPKEYRSFSLMRTFSR